MRRKRLYLLLILPAAAVILALILFLSADRNAGSYEEAETLLRAGEYGEAQAAFEALGEYRDSAVQAGYCAGLLLEEERQAAYAEAAAMFEREDYEGAQAAFEAMGDYEDAADRVRRCGERLEEIRRREAYDGALALFEAGDYSAAQAAFEALGDYEDAEARAFRCVLCAVQPGELITLGRWVQEEGAEASPIAWTVLAREDERLLLLSVYGLEPMQYAPRLYPFWANSPVRDWLNGEYLRTAFTGEEAAMICTVTNSTEDYVGELGHYLGGPDSEDRVFLLSSAELSRYLPEKTSRRCEASAYALSAGAAVDASGFCDWWLRSPGDHHGQVSRVRANGEVNAYTQAGNSRICVRPALWLSVGG